MNLIDRVLRKCGLFRTGKVIDAIEKLPYGPLPLSIGYELFGRRFTDICQRRHLHLLYWREFWSVFRRG